MIYTIEAGDEPRDRGARRSSSARTRGGSRSRREAAEQFDRELRAALAGTVWHTGCTNWYVDENGNDPNQSGCQIRSAPAATSAAPRSARRAGDRGSEPAIRHARRSGSSISIGRVSDVAAAATTAPSPRSAIRPRVGRRGTRPTPLLRRTEVRLAHAAEHDRSRDDLRRDDDDARRDQCEADGVADPTPVPPSVSAARDG